MKWKDKLISSLLKELDGDLKWKELLKKAKLGGGVAIHLAIFTEPFLSLIFQEKKKVESRFSINKVMPYGGIKEGDIVLVKESGGPVVGIFIAGQVKFLSNLNHSRLLEIEKNYGSLICSHYDPSFWRNRSKSNYATLIAVKKLKRINPVPSGKNDRRGWVILNPSFTNNLFEVESD